MTNEELLSVAEIVERLVARFNAQAAEHEAKMVEHRAAFGARTEADRQIIAGLRKDRDGLLTQVQDMRAEIERLQWENKTMHKDAEDGYAEAIKVLGDPIALSKERDALRAEVAALQERLRASIARGDFAQMDLSALKSQIPKQHPVRAGDWVRRTVPHTDGTPPGSVQQVRAVLPAGTDSSTMVYEMTSGSIWAVDYCEPCDPPEATHEATHDTTAGRSAAESAALKTEPVADEIKVGDLVEVVSNRGRNTWLADVGSLGTVTSVDEINDSISVHLDDVPGKKNALAGYVSFCDVRKVTT